MEESLMWLTRIDGARLGNVRIVFWATQPRKVMAAFQCRTLCNSAVYSSGKKRESSFQKWEDQLNIELLD